MPHNEIGLFNAALTKDERKVVTALKSPTRIQSYLDDLPYRAEYCYRCPLNVLRDQRAHCFDGALFAAVMLQRLGYPPMIVHLFAEGDDDHILALYQVDGHWGALAKSNFAGLRFREPVYRNLRELVMSYFEGYYNPRRRKSLRGYTVPLNLTACDRLHWMTSDEHLDRIEARLDAARRVPLLARKMIARLSPVDGRSFKAGMVGTDPAGVYRPE